MANSSHSQSPPVSDWNYEATVAEIEALMSQIESGDLELAEVFEHFALAVEYLKQCEAFLAHKRSQVDIIIETLTDDPGF